MRIFKDFVLRSSVDELGVVREKFSFLQSISNQYHDDDDIRSPMKTPNNREVQNF